MKILSDALEMDMLWQVCKPSVRLKLVMSEKAYKELTDHLESISAQMPTTKVDSVCGMKVEINPAFIKGYVFMEDK